MQANKTTSNAITQDFRNKGRIYTKDEIMAELMTGTDGGDQVDVSKSFEKLKFNNNKGDYTNYNTPHLEQMLAKNKAKEFDFDFKNEVAVHAQTIAIEKALSKKQKEPNEDIRENLTDLLEIVSPFIKFSLGLFIALSILVCFKSGMDFINTNHQGTVAISNVVAVTPEQKAQELKEQAKLEIETNKKVVDVIKKSGSYDRVTQEKINAHLLSIMDINAQLGQGNRPIEQMSRLGAGVVDNLTAAKNLIDKGAAK